MIDPSRFSRASVMMAVSLMVLSSCLNDGSRPADPDFVEPPGCGSDERCADGERCDESTGECVRRIPELVFILEITDTSPGGDGACQSGINGAPGSDIMAAELVVDGAPPGGYWAKAVHWATVPAEDGPNLLGNPPQHLLDGVRPEYDISNGACPDEFVDATVMSLGCGGKLWVEFRDSDGFRVEVPTDGSASLWVYEYGDPLCSRGTRDRYKVEMCAVSKDELATATGPDDVDCRGKLLIDDEAGLGRALDISGPPGP